ncbi:uncharacterized protein LOC108672550, partial [Hyalella azteca]|uniref:Uncharacterized protein LOC108672550 n=1 Tax=Hyalella azteca TaxID=294128 RepID=A0A8B7NRN8_HYAAZ
MDNSVMDVDAPVAIDAISQHHSIKPYIENLYSNNTKKCFQAVVELKIAVIGSPKSKGNVIMQGCVARLLQILRAPDLGMLLKTEVVTVINSLAKGQAAHAASLVQAGVLPVLWEQLEACGVSNMQENTSQFFNRVTFSNSNDTGNIEDELIDIRGSPHTNDNNTNGSAKVPPPRRIRIQKVLAGYTQMLLCCLRSIYRQGCVPPPPSWNLKLLSTLIKHGYTPPTNQECVANILAYACKSAPRMPRERHISALRLRNHHTTACEEQQKQLVEAGAGQLVASMLRSSLTTVQLPALHCLAALARNNDAVSAEVSRIQHCGVLLPDRLVELLNCYTEPAVQLAAATALVWLHRSGALVQTDPRIKHKTLQCL